MKKIFLTFGIALLGFTAAFAQDSDVYQPTEEATETEAVETEATETEAIEGTDATETETDATGTDADAIKNEENIDMNSDAETTEQ